jgi:hypothetical protein
MSVKKEPSGRRSIQVEIEVPGTPEEVWQAIATGSGVSAWFRTWVRTRLRSPRSGSWRRAPAARVSCAWFTVSLPAPTIRTTS